MAAVEPLAQLGHGQGPNGQAQAAHRQQGSKLGGAKPGDSRSQADRQHVKGGKQAVEQHQLHHGAEHPRPLPQHLKPLADLLPHGCAARRPRRLLPADSADGYGRQAIAKRQQQKFTAADADSLQAQV